MMNPVKSRPGGYLNVVFLIVAIITCLFAGIRFDFTVFGYLFLIVVSPVLVLAAADMKHLIEA